ncbi:MAG TPA: acyl carrier protein [Bryobacteraceae bacterium]|nr:acyl carrier protein [Bryobacteraceae bacterium]
MTNHTMTPPAREAFTREAMEKAVVEALARTLRIPESEIRPESRLEVLGLDSMGMINVNIALEERFQVALPACEEGPAVQLQTVQDFADFVFGKAQEAASW